MIRQKPTPGDPVNAARKRDEEVVLCINSGSSSLKVAIFLVAPGTERKPRQQAPSKASAASQGEVWVREEAGAPRKETGIFSDHARGVRGGSLSARTCQESHPDGRRA